MTLGGGIYVHVPFCVQKCAYCDFYSIATLDLAEAYVKALQREIALQATSQPNSYMADSVYFGGGTPSVLVPEKIADILQALHENYAIELTAEITLEVNPATADLVKLEGFRAAGVNRLSIGMQSFQDHKLTLLGRGHGVTDSLRLFADARQAGFDNINIDLIYGLPGQTMTDLLYDLQAAVTLGAEHISAYLLSLEPHTLLHQRIKNGEIPAPDEVFQRAAFDTARAFLRAHDYVPYEVSNFARPQRQSRHNQKYWNFSPYLGFGPAAHAFLPPNRRSWNINSVKRYVECLERDQSALEGAEELTPEQLQIEMVYLGLRQSRGIDIAAFDALNAKGFARICRKPLSMFVNEGLMELHADFCRLTDQGAPLLDYITRVLVQCL